MSNQYVNNVNTAGEFYDICWFRWWIRRAYQQRENLFPSVQPHPTWKGRAKFPLVRPDLKLPKTTI